MNLPYYIINMNIPGFVVPPSICQRQPSQQDVNRFRTAVEAWKKENEGKAEADRSPKPEAPKVEEVSNAAVCHDIIKTALTMAVPEGNPDTLRKLQKLHVALEEGLNNGGQLFVSKDDYRFIQSKYAKADKWNTAPDVCKTVIAVQDAISRAAYVTTKDEK